MHWATPPGQTLSRRQRIAFAALGIGGLLLLVMARNLEPDPRGFGTHEQLGLTPCYFHLRTGYPCPTCGVTTAWAHAMQGNFAPAMAANLGGTVLLLLVVAGVPWLLLSAARGRWLLFRPTAKLLLIIATAWMALLIFDWLRRWFMH